ncbi:hypothetical protein BDN70DRAFT_992580 [Pholiota conissans]|uniref:Uncharacterized protein n=1 Tax=Pholiota conissans TaxID=109636 RepID=A0A9P5Z345_9AGAR|nr:hypothetical protein BDN70DRAFT_992580 [Pholiota conissans]
MIDPLSGALAVIALATALKDIIETAQVIRDSFSKYPHNFRNARRLAEEVLKILRGMEEIYQENRDVLDKAKALKKAVGDLQVEMKSAHEQCIRLIPPTSERKRDRFKVAFYAFWRRKKIEDLLSDLRENVDRCSQQFHLLSSIRTEALVFEIRNAVVQSSSYGAVDVRGQNSSSNSSATLYSGLGSATNAHLFSFTQTTPMPMTWMTDTIPAHDLSRAYLRRELGRVKSTLQSALIRWSRRQPFNTTINGISVSWFLAQPSVSSTVVHQDAVVLAFRFQSVLQDEPNDSCLQHADRILNELCINLMSLRMAEDGVAVATLKVDLWKAVCAQYPSSSASRQLARSLTHLSVALSDSGNHKEARSKSEEAINIFWPLAAHGTAVHEKRTDMEFISGNMMLQAASETLPGRARHLAIDAMRILEFAFGFQDLKRDLDPETSTMSPSIWAILTGFQFSSPEERAITDDHWFSYASTALQTGHIFRHSPDVSLSFARSARHVLNYLLTRYPLSNKVQDELTTALGRLTNNVELDTMGSEALAEHLEFSKQNVDIIRRLAAINPQQYVSRLANALWSRSSILAFTGKSAEAKDAFRDILSLRELAAAPPHADLRIPSETEADYYIRLAVFHHLSRRFPDAILAAQNAISQYSALEFMEPARSRVKHINALGLLCNYWTFTQQYEAILVEAPKAIAMIDNASLLDSNSPEFIESYRMILGTLMEALEATGDSPRAVVHAEEIVTRIQKSAQSTRAIYEGKSSQIPLRYVRLLQKNKLVAKAIEYVSHIRVRENWEAIFGTIDEVVKVVTYIQCLMEIPSLYKGQGDSEEALKCNEEARKFVSVVFDGVTGNAFVDLVSQTLDSEYVILLCSTDRYTEALEYSQKAVRAAGIDGDFQTAVDTTNSTNISTILQGHIVAQLYNLMPEEAAATARKALPICREISLSDPTMRTHEYFNLLSLCICYHDIGNIPEAFKYLEEAEKLALELQSVGSMEKLRATGDTAYETLVTKRSRLLFAQGDYEAAVSLIEKVQTIQRERSKNDNSAVPEFANTLVYLSILYCTLGRHQDGHAAAIELEKLKQDIKTNSPPLYRMLTFGMNFLMKRGAWKPVDEAKRKLACTHQDGH